MSKKAGEDLLAVQVMYAENLQVRQGGKGTPPLVPSRSLSARSDSTSSILQPRTSEQMHLAIQRDALPQFCNKGQGGLAVCCTDFPTKVGDCVSWEALRSDGMLSMGIQMTGSQQQAGVLTASSL